MRASTTERTPGNMTMAMRMAPRASGARVLRVGLLAGKSVVEERIFRKRRAVTFGGAETSDFVVASLPESPISLFELEGQDYAISFCAGDEGRVGIDGAVYSLAELVSEGLAEPRGERWRFRLDDASRGRIELGGYTVLFQFVTPPPVTPPAVLPQAARDGFMSGIDWLFTALVVFSYMVLFGFVVYLEGADFEQPGAGLRAVPESVARLIFEEPPPPSPDEPSREETSALDPRPEEPEVVAQTRAPTRVDPRPQDGAASAYADAAEAPPGPARTQPERAAQVASLANEYAGQIAEQLHLGAFGGAGAFADGLAGGADTSDPESILADAQRVRGADMRRSELRTRTPHTGSVSIMSLQGLAERGPARSAMEGMRLVERRVTQLRLDGRQVRDIAGGGEIDAQAVIATVRLRMRAIQLCYERQLGRDAAIEGRVSVEFTIQPRGNTTNVRATSNSTGSANVARCATETIGRIRFDSGPEGGSVTFSFPLVFAPQR